MPYQPALDGLRALSVIAVILYHGGFSWMPGGFFGVEVFFVISGFLITSLLLDERERSRRSGLAIDLRQFWMRRARRLLPALAVVLAAVATWTMLAGTAQQRAELRRDLPWSIFYVSNWGQIVGDVPYYASVPLLRHLWSLAVEEQWYLVWPLIFCGLSALGLRRASAASALATAALIVMVLTFVWHGNGPGPVETVFGEIEDRTNFLYLSTFTRCSGLLLGAAAAYVWRPWRWPKAAKLTSNLPVLEAAGGAAVAGLAVIACSAVLVEGYVYQWLLALVSILSLVAVLAAVHPGASWFRHVLSWQPLVELGKRSYGLYLWHWPIFVFCEATDGSAQRVVGALMITAAVSELCYRFVETPVRRGALGRWWRATTLQQRRVRLAMGGALVLTLVGFYASVGPYDRAVGGEDATFSAPTPAGGSTTVAPAARGPLNVVLVGDSTAHSLAVNAPEGLDDVIALTNGALDGCSVYDGGRVRTERDGVSNSFAICEDWQEDWADEAQEADAQVALVVLGAWDVFDLETSDGDVLTFGTSAWDDYVDANLQSGIDALVTAGVEEVALLEVPCMRPQDVSGAAVPALPERADDTRVAHVNQLWRGVAAANADTTTFVEGPDEWCADEEVAADVAYRWDGVHVWRPGANLIFETIVPTLLGL